MSLNFDFWVPPYDYHPPLIEGGGKFKLIYCSFKLCLITQFSNLLLINTLSKWLLIISGHLHRLLSLYCFPPKYPCFPLLPPFSLLPVPLPNLLVNPADLCNSPIRDQKSVVLENDVLQTCCCELKPGHLMWCAYLSAASLRKAFCICIS